MSKASTTTSSSSTDTGGDDVRSSPLKVVFIHLDLGIGGAEQLILNLASATLQPQNQQSVKNDVKILTTRCDQNHCFSHVKKPNGILSNNVHIWGNWIPATIIFGKGTALCSTIRMIYLSICCCIFFETRNADIIVMDVLPTSIPLLISFMKHAGILFYCHFPDKLLVRDTVNGEPTTTTQRRSTLFTWYRNWLDYFEEVTMNYADILVVNSNFTKERVQAEMTTIRDRTMHVLYPSLNMEKFTKPNFSKSSKNSNELPPIVSLNRFERKKNIGLLLEAYAKLLQQNRQQKLPRLVIAGGYDIKNEENVLYLQELRQLANSLDIPTENIDWKPNVSDDERSQLLTSCLCLVYTPHLEHFGIVPLECMYAGRPVVALASGGPLETIVHNKTGFLCKPNDSSDMAKYLKRLIDESPTLSIQMGKAAHEHVKTKFSTDNFEKEWMELLYKTIQAGKKRRVLNRGKYRLQQSLIYLMEAAVIFGMALLLTYLLRWVGILEADAHIWSTVKNAIISPRQGEL